MISNLSNKLDILEKSVVYLGNEKYLSRNHVIAVKHKYNAKYLVFVLNTNFYKQQIKKYSKNGTVYNCPIIKIKQIKTLLPLIEENKKQYEYYRDSIFSNK